MTAYDFDDRKLRWYSFGDFKHFVIKMYDIDRERNIIDFMIKFEPNERIFLHRHLALTNTLVVQGEHRLYEPNGPLKEIRPVGSYTSSPPGGPHREGGGPEGAVVFYSMRPEGEGIFEALDDNMKVIATFTLHDFVRALEEQKAF